MTAFGGGAIGALFLLWISGLRVINPTQVGWVMQSDWRIHFLGWHFFRRESWMWPPGRIDGYFHAPDGTAVGFTDSIPVVAFLLKPLSSLLPDPFQYLGIWLLLCFILQGVFGVLLARIWTPDRSLQLVVAAFFVLTPTLLIRAGHPSLCAHWLLLWTLWLYFRGAVGERQHVAHYAASGLLAGLIHPYLAVMVLASQLALAIKDRHAMGLMAGLVAVLSGWWASGLFTVSGTENLGAGGLGDYSMNLLSVITPSGWSTLLPEQPIGAPGQTFEGFQYLGAGALLLLTVAAALQIRRTSGASIAYVAPVFVTSAICAVYALSPRVTAFDRVVVDLTGPLLDRFAIFRATGRFFWPMAYLLMLWGVAAVLTRLGGRTALLLLSAVVALQLVDFRRAHLERHLVTRTDAFHAHVLPLQSPVWAAALPHYRHLVLLSPQHCGPSPAGFEWPAFIAGLYGLTVNAGELARPDQDKMRAYCEALSAQIRDGHVADDTVYLVNRTLLDALRTKASQPLVCGDADRIPLCVTRRSSEAWRATVGWP